VKGGIKVPTYYHQIKHSPQREEWEAAMRKEMQTLIDLGTFEIISEENIPKNAMMLRAHHVFDVKLDSKGNKQRLKDRYVARGDLENREWKRLTKTTPMDHSDQKVIKKSKISKMSKSKLKDGSDKFIKNKHETSITNSENNLTFDKEKPFFHASVAPSSHQDVSNQKRPELFAPTAQMYLFRQIVCIFIMFMKPFGGVIKQIDGVNAFPNSNLPEDHPPIVIPADEQFTSYVPSPYNKAKWILLKKALYGLRCASRAWYLTLQKFLLKVGFTVVGLNECMYVLKGRKISTDNKRNRYADLPIDDDCEINIILLVYVDDIVVAAKNQKYYDWFKDKMSEIIAVKELGDLQWFLGNRIEWLDDRVELSQTTYIEAVLDKYNLTEIKPKAIPATQGYIVDPEKSKQWRLHNDKPDFDYRGLMGCLLYINTCTRPDISVPVSMLARVNDCFSDDDVKAIIQVLAYLDRSKNHKLTYMYNPKEEIDKEMVFYADAAFATSKPIPKSRTGVVGKWLGGAVWWSSKLQTTVSASTSESEYIALYVATIAALGFREVWNIIFDDEKRIIIYGDNTSANRLATAQEAKTSMKYLNVKMHVVRERHALKHIDIRQIGTKNQIADIMTKNLARVTFNHLRHQLLQCTQCQSNTD
jgi:hypothetical protein